MLPEISKIDPKIGSFVNRSLRIQYSGEEFYVNGIISMLDTDYDINIEAK